MKYLRERAARRDQVQRVPFVSHAGLRRLPVPGLLDGDHVCPATRVAERAWACRLHGIGRISAHESLIEMNEAALQGDRDRVRAVPGVELSEDALEVRLYGFGGATDRLSDL